MKDPKELYARRAKRVEDAIALKEPDRIPLIVQPLAFPVYYAGLTMQECMEDYRKVGPALDRFYNDFPQIDLGWGPRLIFPDSVLRACGLYYIQYPGHGVDDPHQMYQFIEGENMQAHEYDELIHDPTHFFQSKWIPRCFTKLKGLEKLRLRNSFWMGWMGSFAAFSSPDLIEALEALKKTAEELSAWSVYNREYETRMENDLGLPPASGSSAFAPFDILGDTLRGTVNIMMDILDRPDKVLEAVEKLIPISIEAPVAACKATGRKRVWIWLHKGMDDFMSEEQYNTFYWPSLKAMLDGFIAEGLNPFIYCEGKYNMRLETLRDIPKGKVVYDFEYVEMERAKDILGDVACIAGNVPNSMLAFGTADEVDAYCKNLIGTVGQDGGFMLDAGALIDNAKPENLRTMFDSVEKYG